MQSIDIVWIRDRFRSLQINRPNLCCQSVVPMADACSNFRNLQENQSEREHI